MLEVPSFGCGVGKKALGFVPVFCVHNRLILAPLQPPKKSLGGSCITLRPGQQVGSWESHFGLILALSGPLCHALSRPAEKAFCVVSDASHL